jgi:hypothetical protein
MSRIIGGRQGRRSLIQTGMTAILSKKLLIKRLSWVAAGLLLFSQLVLSAQACMLPGSNLAYVFNDAMATEGCDGVPMDKGTCLADCLKADQASGRPVDFHFDAIVPPASLIARLSALRLADSSSPSSCFSHYPSGPPLQILFCSFQT